ncbi:ABC transporter substrate-binding protein [Arthrobacter sp. STN4]|uniref:ABC transporter substrate-binding protein n=1 Tax=Arthrobacter sp. STN4 TaxID=2923276 RepID=UPI002119CEE2|nr:ABC transporter substrate-binding protein [Arthrobacter sp. STN4]MCQ9165861.1 ABC transporter substrate-binding protein [Arthrobacter sp. STN4]
MIGLAGCSSAPGTSTAAVNSTPKDGGTLRVGIVGGSAKDSLDAHSPVTHPDEARVIQLYETLATYDVNHKVEMALADKITPSADAKIWTVHLRDGLKFSNGKPITANDVIFTFKRITDPKAPMAGANAFSALNRDGLKAVDAQTIIFPFKTPFATFPDTVAQYSTGIVPVGYDPKNPVGSGPFMMKDFTAGQQSTFVKNPYYWRKGEPNLAAVTIIDFPDDTARVNALLGGQVDAIDQLPLGQINIVKANPALKVLESATGSWVPFTMRVDQPPFNDPKVRQAFRLIVDRKQMVEQVLGGHGTIGNDLYAPFDACYAKGIPQRSQNIAKARQLLAEAGKTNLSVDLVTSSAAAGMVEAAQVFAQQAKAAGVTVNVKKVDPGEFYGDKYLQWNFSQDFWFTRDFLPQTAASGFSNSPYNETHWDNKAWSDLVNKANATVDMTARCALIQQAQQIEFNDGGYIIWGFPNSVDAYSAAVQGFSPDKSGIPLTSFGFRSVWMNK